MSKNECKKSVKYSRKRRILSCFRCRYLRNKCDRVKPRCGRCVENNCDKCEYMTDNGSREEYIKHLKSNGHRDNRVPLNDDLPCRKVRFEVPMSKPKCVKKPINNEISKLLYRTAMDLRTPVKKDNLSYISILDKSINKKSTTSETEGKELSLKYTAEIFDEPDRIVNKLLIQNRNLCTDEPFQYQVTAQSSLCLDQMYYRLMPNQLKELWKEMSFDHYHQIDFEKYSRLSTAKTSNAKFLQNWDYEKKSLFEELLVALPKDIGVFQKIVFEFFNTDLHKTFTFLNEDDVKRMFYSIFKFDKKTGKIKEVFLEDYQDQYYLGIIITIFQLMIDPELYHDPIFKKISDVIYDIKSERFRNGYLKCQFYLLVLFKNEMHFKASFTTNKRIINDLMTWAQEIEKSYKDVDIDTHEQEIINNTWCWIMYFEIIAYVELGIAPRFNNHFLNDDTFNRCERGRAPLMKKLSLLVGKIALACGNPSFNPDIDYLCMKIDEFIERHLAPIDYYIDAEKCKKIDAFDFNIINPLLSLKLSLWTYKYALATDQKEINDLKDSLFGLSFVARKVFYTQQTKIQYEVENIKNIDSYSFDKYLNDLKKHERLEENKKRPIWVPQLIGPNFMMFGSEVLYDRAATLIELISLVSLNDYFKSENRKPFEFELSEDFAQKLDAALIYHGLGRSAKLEIEYNPLDVVLIHDKSVNLKIESDLKMPVRVGYPILIFLEYACIIKDIISRLDLKEDETFNYGHILKAYESYKIEKKNENRAERKSSGSKEQSVVDSNMPYYSPNEFDLKDLWSDLEDLDIPDFMKLLN